MILAIVKLFLQIFLIVYLSFTVIQALSFASGDCAIRSLRWFRFWDRIPGISPNFIEAKLDKAQFDIEGNEYTHHIFLRLDFGLFSIPWEGSVGLPLNPMWNFGGLTGDRDLSNPKIVSEAGVLDNLNDYQRAKL